MLSVSQCIELLSKAPSEDNHYREYTLKSADNKIWRWHTCTSVYAALLTFHSRYHDVLDEVPAYKRSASGIVSYFTCSPSSKWHLDIGEIVNEDSSSSESSSSESSTSDSVSDESE